MPENTEEQNVGNLAPSHHLAEDIALPIREDLGAVPRMTKAVDVAAVHRKGCLLTGPKGCGKGVAVDWVVEWFKGAEKAKRVEDNTYRRRKILKVGDEIRDTDYRNTAVLLCKRLDPSYRDRKRGAKKETNEIRQDFVQLCLKRNYAVILLDEAERCSDETLLFFRDFITDAEKADKARSRVAGAKTAAGVGVVLVGVPNVEHRVALTEEAGERWVSSFSVNSLGLGDVLDVLDTWFPGFDDHIRRVGSEAWQNYVASAFFRGDGVSFRLLENAARTYAHYIARSRPEILDRDQMPFVEPVFESALSDVMWAKSATGREASVRRSA